ncbi:hypothetical protein ATCC90586_003236 [Pythium insidiosum]|nr:hypothetical protein ATCC90586_003236 [Pythium insidiosum]
MTQRVAPIGGNMAAQATSAVHDDPIGGSTGSITPVAARKQSALQLRRTSSISAALMSSIDRRKRSTRQRSNDPTISEAVGDGTRRARVAPEPGSGGSPKALGKRSSIEVSRDSTASRSKALSEFTIFLKIMDEVAIHYVTLYFINITSSAVITKMEESFTKYYANSQRKLYLRGLAALIAFMIITFSYDYAVLWARMDFNSAIKANISARYINGTKVPKFTVVVGLKLAVVLPLLFLTYSRARKHSYSEDFWLTWICVTVVASYPLVYNKLTNDYGVSWVCMIIMYIYSCTPIRFFPCSVFCFVYLVIYVIVMLAYIPESTDPNTPGPTREHVSTETLYACLFYLLILLPSQSREFAIRVSYMSELMVLLQQEQLKMEEARSKALLNSMLPQSIVNQLQSGRELIADAYSSVTVLFAEVCDFDYYSSKLKPQHVVELLNIIFYKFDKLVDVHLVHKVETIGAVYMVVGGCPDPVENHAERVANLALDMIRCVPDVSDKIARKSWGATVKNLNIRIGINSGSLMAGVVGIRNPRFKLFGDTVNVASRMETTNLPGQIQITEATYLILKDSFFTALRGKVFVKGRGDMNTYFLRGRGNYIIPPPVTAVITAAAPSPPASPPSAALKPALEPASAKAISTTSPSPALRATTVQTTMRTIPVAATPKHHSVGATGISPTARAVSRSLLEIEPSTTSKEDSKEPSCYSAAEPEPVPTVVATTEVPNEPPASSTALALADAAAASSSTTTSGVPRQPRMTILRQPRRQSTHELIKQQNSLVSLMGSGGAPRPSNAMTTLEGSISLASQKASELVTATIATTPAVRENGGTPAVLALEQRRQTISQIRRNSLRHVQSQKRSILRENIFDIVEEAEENGTLDQAANTEIMKLPKGLTRFEVLFRIHGRARTHLSQEAFEFEESYRLENRGRWLRFFRLSVLVFLIVKPFMTMYQTLRLSSTRSFGESHFIFLLNFCAMYPLGVVFLLYTFSPKFVHSEQSTSVLLILVIALTLNAESIAANSLGHAYLSVIALYQCYFANISFLLRVMTGCTIVVIYLLTNLVVAPSLGWNADPEKFRVGRNALYIFIFFGGQAWVVFNSEFKQRINHYREITLNSQKQKLVEEEARITKLLLNLLPETIVHKLKDDPEATIADFFDNVTVLFTDMVNFTAYSSKVSAMELVQFLNDMYTRFDTIAEKEDLYKVEIIGDAYFVVGGCPIVTTNNALAVVTAATDMFAVLPYLRRNCGVPDLNIRIGIHSGPVLAGVVGSKDPRYHLFGETVTIAHSLESSGVPGRIHISEATWSRMNKDTPAHGFKVEYHTLLSIHGYSKKIRTYFVL